MRLLYYSLFLFLFALFLNSCGNDLVISHKGESDYRIIIPATATKPELKAASYLQRYVENSGGARLPIIRDREDANGLEISVGRTNRLSAVEQLIPANLDNDGFAIFEHSNNLYFVGESEKAVIYAVSSFSERYLGVQILSSTVQIVKESKAIRIPKDLNWTYIPPFNFRSTHYRDTWDPFYADWHKLHHLPNGGHPDWGYWCHSFDQLVPPSKYFDKHPEYYAELNGNRVPTQLCVSNPDVLQISVESLRKAIAEKPDLKYWSVSQNDNVSYCRCDECQKLDKENDSPMGSLMTYINAIADSFPDHIISTLAYQYSRKPPSKIIPKENVNIMLCTIELNRSESIANSDDAASFRSDLEGWGRISKDILLWDYVIQFENLVSPFPNFHVLQPNLQYFLENNATKHFQQANREVGGEFAELRGYLISKLLWEPYANLDSLTTIFLDGYYGKASKYIRRYIERQEEELINSGARLDIFGHPIHAINTYLSNDLIETYKGWFDHAEEAVASEPDILTRVQQARMPLQYAQIEIATRLGTAEGGMYIKNESGQWEVKSELKDLARTLVSRAVDQGVTRFKEWHTTPEEYLAGLEKSWLVDMQDHLAMGLEPELLEPVSPKYGAGNANMLTDGLRGPALTYAYNWLGFEGNECIAVIDLGKVTEISQLSSSWLHDARSWVFRPHKLSYFGSLDGKSWDLLGEISSELDPTTSGVLVLDFPVEILEKAKARYVKIETASFINCPQWHHGAGGPAWIFIDEIIVN